jgi:hypothetical protein
MSLPQLYVCQEPTCWFIPLFAAVGLVVLPYYTLCSADRPEYSLTLNAARHASDYVLRLLLFMSASRWCNTIVRGVVAQPPFPRGL